MFVPSRRLLDYCELKYKNITKDKDNYIVEDQLYLNKYKTAKYLGTQMVEYPKQASALLKQFIKYNKQYYPQNDYLLIDSKGNHLNNVQLNQRINNIFDGKKVGINGLRHEYLTDKYKDIPLLKDMEQVAYDMGKTNNITGLLEYDKKD